jgi:hypothetical protein
MLFYRAEEHTMKVFAAAAVVAGVAAMASPAFAASDTWNQTGGTHNWRDGANWLSGVQYPDGAGDVAGFTNDITAAQLVTNGTAVTVGTIHLGDSAATLFGFTVGAFANTINLDNGGSASVVNNLAGVNVIQAKLVATGANQDLTVNLAAGSLNIGSTGTQSPMTIDTLRINLASGVTLGLGTAGSTLTDPNVYLDGAGTVNILGNHALPTNSVVTLSNGATLAGGGGRVQDLAEIRGNGVFRSGGNARLVVGSPTANYDSVTFGGTTITNGGRLRPGDITGTGEIGTLFIGTPPVPNATHLTVGGEYFFDIASHSLFDQIDIRRTITTVTGGDVYINFVGSFSSVSSSTPAPGGTWTATAGTCSTTSAMRTR